MVERRDGPSWLRDDDDHDKILVLVSLNFVWRLGFIGTIFTSFLRAAVSVHVWSPADRPNE